ncbi:MAG TPA: cation diffusion facilitator family transporter [Actinomycetes bacterium]|nr:cation diffusion facilitator family transporter [Actinomycetes bacterium]
MGHGHGDRAAGHVGRRYRSRLAIAFVLTATVFLVELVAGLLSGSLALIADAGHMATDVVALGASVVATRIAVRKDTSGRRSFGSYRAEVFASGLAVLMMLGVGIFVIVEAIQRIGADPDIASTTMLVVGALGLVVNLTSLALLRRGAAESLNVKGAYLEVLGDAVGSLGVLVAGLLIAWTGNPMWDTLVALGIGAFVLVRAYGLGRQVFAVLAQHVPAGMHLSTVEADLGAIPGVDDVHDLHIWTLTSGMHVATAHLVTSDGADAHGILDAARIALQDRHGIAHATLQVEPSTHEGCEEVGW